MSDDRIAVLDIGKTNKKVIIFSRDLEIIDEIKQGFDEVERDGVLCEDVEAIKNWFIENLKTAASKHKISAISVTTHGAMCVPVDGAGEIAAPTVAYTHDAGKGFDYEFFRHFGSREALQGVTCTAEIGSLINLGKLIYYVQKSYPTAWGNVRWVLNYPQYFGFVLTGKVGAEPTYTGCHTYLFNHREGHYSYVAERLGLKDKLPEKLQNSWDVLGKISPEISEQTGLSEDCVVTLGVHDSNASLVPYIAAGFDDFLLNSTGTWCVAMHPTDNFAFRREELGKTVFFNLDVYCRPVKTSIFMGGLEFETYTKILQEKHKRDDFPLLKPEMVQKIAQEKKLFFLPSVVRGAGLFPEAKPCVMEDGKRYDLASIEKGNHPKFFEDYELAMAALTLSLGIQTRLAGEYTGYAGEGHLFIEGGFTRNEPYKNLLAALHPDATVATTDLKEATALGAALLARCALEGKEPKQMKDAVKIKTAPVKKIKIDGLDDYEKAFLEAVG